MRIVIGSDKALAVQAISAILTARGHVIAEVAESGDAAIEATWRLRPDLLLIDEYLPPPMGVEVAMRVAANVLVMACVHPLRGVRHVVLPTTEAELVAAVERAVPD